MNMQRAWIPVVTIVVIATSSPLIAGSPDPGTRLIVEDEKGPARLNIQGKAPEPVEPGEGVSLGVRSHYVTLPDGLLDAYLLNHTSLHSYSVGLEVGIDGPAGSRVIFGIDYTDLGMPSGNWRKDGERPEQASYTVVDLHLISAEALFLWRIKFNEFMGFNYGAGLGVGYTPGSITSIDVLPTCEKPVAKCGHWKNVTSREQEMPSRIWPIITFQAGFYFDPAPGFRVRIQGGFRGFLFTGVSVRSTF